MESQHRILDALTDALVAEGVRLVANVPDEITILAAEMFRRRGIRIVRPRHEQNAVLIADGYSRATGDVGVCMVGAGPAVAQTGTALVTAAKKGSPVLMLVGRESDAAPKGGVKEFDLKAFAAALGVVHLEIRNEATLAVDVAAAFLAVKLGRGPVILSLPARQLLLRKLPGAFEYVRHVDPAPTGISTDSEAIEAAAAILLDSRRPFILAGRGAVLSGARDELLQLARNVGAVLGTSLQARELFRGEPRAAGIVGSLGSDVTNALVARADCIFAAGIALNHYQLGGVPPQTRLIHVDSEPSHLGRHTRVNVPIVADCTAAIRALNAVLVANDLIRPTSAWSDEDLATVRQRRDFGSAQSGDEFDLSDALSVLDEVLPEDRFVIVDAGLFVASVVESIRVPDPQRWIWTADFGSIGLGLGIGMGAALGAPGGTLCVVFAGDGGLGMNAQELDTLFRENIPLVVVVLNNAAYLAEKAFLGAAGLEPTLAEYSRFDFAEVATAFGGSGVSVLDAESLRALGPALRESRGPFVVNVAIAGKERNQFFHDLGKRVTAA